MLELEKLEKEKALKASFIHVNDVEDDDVIDELPVYDPKRRHAAVSAAVKKRKISDTFAPQTVKKSIEARMRILDILNTHKLFNKLDSEQREMMADAMRPIEKADGDIIIKQGDAAYNI